MHNHLVLLPHRALLRLACVAFSLLIATLAAADCRVPYWSQGPSVAADVDFIAAADFNGDARPDVAANSATAVLAILNDGTGVLGAPATVYNGTVRGRLHVRDMNLDGKADLLFAGATALVVVAGNGDGTFDPGLVSTIDIAPAHLAIGSFNQDNTPDVLALDNGLSRLVLYTNNGNGVLQEAARIAVSANASSLSAADVDGDAWTDALVGAADGNYYAYYGNGDGTFDEPALIRGDGYPATGLRAAHADTNGLLDLFAYSNYRLSILRNLGGRNYGDPATYFHYKTGGQGGDFEVGELTGDGDTDAVTFNRDCSIRTYSGTGLGTFDWGLDAFYGYCHHFSFNHDADLGDFDGDGRKDLVVTPVIHYDLGYHPVLSDGVKIFRNLCGDGKMDVTVDTPVINPGATATIRAYVRPTDDDVWSYYYGTGTATLEQNGQAVATAQLVTGTGSFPRSGLPLGTHTYTVSYGGDEQYEPIASTGPVTIRVTSDTTTTTLSVDPLTSQWGMSPPPLMTITVTSSTGSTPTGKLEVTLDGKKICYNDCNAPRVSFPMWQGDDIGTHTVTAKFLGDANHPPSAAADVTYTIVKRTPALGASPTAGRAGKPFDISVSVTGANYSPTGTLTLYNGATQLGSTPAGYCCTYLTVPALPEGQHTLRLTYSGDTYYNAVEKFVTFTIFPATGSWLDARGTGANIVVRSLDGGSTGYGRRKRAIDAWSSPDDFFYPGTWTDTTAVAGTVYLYRLQSYDGTATSNVDLAQRISFTDDPLAAGTRIRSVHLQEVVAGTNALRTAAGLTPLPSSAYTPGTIVTASGINVLRNAINEARATLGAAPVTFATPIATGGIVRASHIQELREAIR